MNGERSNIQQLVVAFGQHGAAMERALLDELHDVAERGAALMRQKAPKHRSTLANSIRVHAPEPMTREIRPGVAYAAAVHDGRKPGKGLPRFFDPAAKSIVEWLEKKAFAGTRKPRKGTGRFTARELLLRDRYMGLSWHVRRHGIKGQPFAKETADELAPMFQARMAARAARELAAGGGAA